MRAERFRLAYCFLWATLPAWAAVGLVGAGGHWLPALATALASAGVFLLPILWARTLRGYYLSLAPLASFTAFCMMYAILYGSPVTAGLIQGVLYTDLRVEMEEGRRYWWVFAASLAGATLYLRWARALPRRPLRWRAPAAAAALYSVLALIYVPYATEWLWMRADWSVHDGVLRAGYPQSLVFSGIEVLRMAGLQQGDDRTDIGAKYTLPAPPPPAGREIYVLVIGEGARAQTWDELAGRGFFLRDGRLVAFGDALAQANWTRLSVPMITTGARHREDVDDLPTITDWERWAGCTTAALSNNASYPYSRAADVKTIIGEDDVVRHNGYDHDLLPALEHFLDGRNAGRLCVTLHMVGSHQRYRERYENRFAVFDAEAADERAALANDYRNTVVMTQDFLARLIRLLDREAGSAFLAYVSDHGENLLEIRGLREHVTETPTEYELRIPTVFWANDRYVAGHAAAWAALRANRGEPVSNLNLLPTFLDAMGVLDAAGRLYPEYGASLLRPFHPEPRFYYSPDLESHPESDMLVDRVAAAPESAVAQ
jgi:glucan phosphoethanolaminetransferase (alkaline phosphatase superfamily)